MIVSLQSKFLMDPGVHALQVLDVIHMKDSTHKMTFYHNLPQVMADIPKVSFLLSFIYSFILPFKFFSFSFLPPSLVFTITDFRGPTLLILFISYFLLS